MRLPVGVVSIASGVAPPLVPFVTVGGPTGMLPADDEGCIVQPGASGQRRMRQQGPESEVGGGAEGSDRGGQARNCQLHDRVCVGVDLQTSPRAFISA
jgi:hypothetical protein